MNKKLAMFRDRDREPKDVGSVLFVDPGLEGTGWAMFYGLNTKPAAAIVPTAADVIRVRPTEYEDGWIGHAAAIIALFRGILAAMKPSTVVLEMPQLWSGNAKSAASAAGGEGETGDLFKLAYLVGGMGETANGLCGSLPILILPYEWKGQLSKEMVAERVERLIGKIPKDHAADAIGMGMAAQGGL